RVKKHPQMGKTAVILVTTLADPVDVIRGLESGADNFIVKPFQEEYLLARVRNIISNRDLRSNEHRVEVAIQIMFGGQRFVINSDRLQILNLLLSSYETAVQRNLALVETQDELRALTETLERRVQERTAELEAEMAKSATAEQAVQKQATILQSVIHSMGDGLVVVNMQHEFIIMNPASVQILGAVVPGSMMPMRASYFRSDRHTPLPESEHPINIALLGQSISNVEVFAKTEPHPEGIMLSFTAQPIRDADGILSGVVVALRDITAQKQMENHILRNQRMDSIGSLAGGIAHDLNNVLAPILMGSDLLQMTQSDPFALRIIDTIHQSAKRGSRLIKQLMTFARGTGDAEHELLDLGPMIEESLKVLSQTFPPNVKLRSEISDDLWPVNGDDTQLDQVLLNLCVNARDAMPSGGVITISAANVVIDALQASARDRARPGAFLQISVSDTGTGIEPAVVERMYEPFFTTKPLGKGTGLGLSTILGIVKAHSGFIEVHTQVGQGTTFEVFLPALTDAHVAPGEERSMEIYRGNDELVLVIDDEEAIRTTASATLEQYGYRAHAVEDGVSAIAWFAQHHREVQIVLSDMTMPHLDGVSTIRALRKLSPNFGVAVISGREESVDRKELAEIGITHILHKPFDIQSLLRMVRTLSEQRQAAWV
ncbi:MAG TPA: response regulator, partial [Candidatus Methylacidiphilales bacterium]|nr:response regulator [Candidatus Methylacidiphilales bacterium]